MTLEGCSVGTAVRLRRVDAPPKRRRRLFELGFVPGTRLEVVGRGGIGGLLVSVNTDTRVAVGAEIAGALHVDLVGERADD